MKHIAITLTALLAAASAFAQGTVNFATRITGSVDARVTYAEGGAPVGSEVWGQLYAAAPGGTLAAVGSPVPFRDTPDAAKGYITAGGTVEIPGVAAGASAQVKLVAWVASLGATYDAAKAAAPGGWAESAVLPSVATGGGTLPPGALVGLQGFAVPAVPEPSIAALGLLGAGLLLIRRKK